ncbi:MAG: AAA family ATPase [Phycisphaerae bacterium]|nr:AAA family ATPase [Phycisphaerae bacterium]
MMKKPSQELVAAFLDWYRNDPHAQNEDHYAGQLTKSTLTGLSREQFVEFFFQFAREGGKVQSGGHRTAPLFRETLEAEYDEFRAFVLNPFEPDFDLLAWLDRIDEFNGFGQGLATIYLNRVDKKRFAIINNKAVEAVELLGVEVPAALGKKYEAVRDAERQLIEWYPEFDNFYRADALSQFLIGEKAGFRWAEELRGGTTTTERRYWIYAPGEKARLWEQYYREEVMGIGWGPLDKDLSTITTEADLRKVYDQAYGGNATDKDFRQLCDFLLKMREGDRVFVKCGRAEIVGYGEVTSGYFYDGNRPEYRHMRKARWLKSGHWSMPDDVKGLPVKTLTEIKDTARTEALLQIIGASPDDTQGSGKPLFTDETFDLLHQLHEQPLASFYNAHAEEFAEAIEAPLQRLMNNVASRLPPQMTELMETAKRVFSRIPKNDYGRGGAWDHYWGAFYPKGSRRIEDAQLYVWINRDAVRFGFYIGDYGDQPKKRFAKACRENSDALTKILEPKLADCGFEYGESEPVEGPSSLPPGGQDITLGQWLSDPESYGFRVMIMLPASEITVVPEETLTTRVTDVFQRLFPLVLISQLDEPMEAIRRFLGQKEPMPEDMSPEYSIATFSTDSHLPPEQIEKWVRAAIRKKHVVFYGPPGTGKTYIALRLARHLTGGGDGFYDILQFHPSYAYEDFMQGLRPKALKGGGLEYSLAPGRFKDFCTKARDCKGPCALVIDEINRANLSRVFGELMFLLEYRDESVPLAGGERFQIPGNVFLIGTMNTADRSIALVDHALRRRFAFLPLYPDYDVLRRFHEDTEFDPSGLISVLDRLNVAISDRHYAVGMSFFMDREIASTIQDVWQMEIEPYIEEHFFDQPEKVASFRWDKVRKEITGE